MMLKRMSGKYVVNHQDDDDDDIVDHKDDHDGQGVDQQDEHHDDIVDLKDDHDGDYPQNCPPWKCPLGGNSEAGNSEYVVHQNCPPHLFCFFVLICPSNSPMCCIE